MDVLTRKETVVSCCGRHAVLSLTAIGFDDVLTQRRAAAVVSPPRQCRREAEATAAGAGGVRFPTG